jgi:hypothetical protein
MTNVFNIFTVMQIFNLICSRKIHDEKNIFDGILRNWMFVGVFLGILKIIFSNIYYILDKEK